MVSEIRHNWNRTEVLALLEQPLNDLLFAAQSVHREFHDPNKIQVSRLLSIKTGKCPEDCAYCPQSIRFNTGLKEEALIEVEEVLNEAQSAKDSGASRFCMGAAWRCLLYISPNPRDLSTSRMPSSA